MDAAADRRLHAPAGVLRAPMRHASTVSEAVAEERESISTRTVTNYNHMHALTVQYYEVVQMYRTELRVQQARRLLFHPFSRWISKTSRSSCATGRR